MHNGFWRNSVSLTVGAALLLAQLKSPALAQGRERGFIVSTSGLATEADKSQAYNEAHDSAVDNLNRKCAGIIIPETIEEIGVQYHNIGIDPDNAPQWQVLVSVKGICRT